MRWIGMLILMASVAMAQPVPDDENAWLRELDRIDSLNNLTAQQQALATLQEKWPDSASPMLQFHWLRVNLAVHHEALQHEAAQRDLDALQALAKQHNMNEPRIVVWMHQALELKESGKPDEGLKRVRDALVLLDNIDDAQLRYRTYIQAGRIYADVGDYESALKEYLRSLPIAEAHERDHPKWLAAALNNISTVYLSLHHIDDAMKFIERAIPLAKALNDQRMLSTLYLNRGYAYTDQGRYQDARQAILDALVIAEKEGLQRYQLGALVNLSDSSLNLKNFAEAESFARRAQKLSAEMNEPTNGAIAQANLGLALVGQGKIKEGIAQLNESYEFFVKSRNLSMQDALLTELARVHEAQQNKDQAITALKAQLQLRQQLYDESRQKAVTEYQERYAAKEKQKQIEKLEQENRLQSITLENQSLQRWIGALVIVVVVLIAVVMFMGYRRIREANTRLAAVNAKLADQSIRDPLTGLFNRRSFHLAMERRRSERDRRHVPEHSTDVFVLLDVDHFKQVNDTYGHAAGDTVLVEIGRRLSAIMRDSDMVLRWGGEEFLVYLRGASVESVQEIIERVLYCIGQTPIDIGTQHITVTASAGFVPLPFAHLSEHVFDWERAVQLADSALYLSKTRGRNQAFGVMDLSRPYDEIARELTHDWSKAISENWVTLKAVAGPVKAEQH